MENDIVAIPRAQYQRWCRRLHNNQHNHLDKSVASSSSTMISIDTEAAASFRSVWRLPPELLLEILSYLADQQSTLYSVSLVCRQWFLCATPILYKHAKIPNTYRWATFILTLGRDKRLFHYGSLAQSIDLSYRKDSDQETTRSTRMLATAATASAMSAPTQPSQASTPTLSTAAMNDVTVITATTTGIDNSEQLLELTPMRAIAAEETPRSAENGTTYELYDILTEDDCHVVFQTAPTLVVSTSSLVQLAQSCQNLVSIDLSYTHMFYDSMIAETGEYISTLQNYAIQPGLTHVKIPLETAISTMGQQCTQLEKVKIQCCGWVSARVIWLWVCSCPNLNYLDARRSSKCSVKRLTATVLQVEKGPHQQPISSSSSVSSSSSQPFSLPRPTASISTSSVSSTDSSDSDSTLASHNEPSASAASTSTDVTRSRQRESRRASRAAHQNLMDEEMMLDMDQRETEYMRGHQRRHLATRVETRSEFQRRQRGILSVMTREATSERMRAEEANQWMDVDGHRPPHQIRRPPSPNARTTQSDPLADAPAESSSAPLSHQTLRDYVWSILKEGKDQGMMELQWLQD